MAEINKETELKRVVGVSGLSLNIINITIGAGIFTLPAIVGLQLGGFSIFAYLFCAVMMAAIMLCYAEVGTKVTESGGSYVYVTAAFGEFAGFVVNCLAVFGWSILGSAALMNIIADSLAVMFPFFEIRWARGLLFFVLLAFLVLTNIRGAKESVTLIKWITVIKVVPLIAIIIFGLSLVDTNNLALTDVPSVNTFGSTILVLFFAFAGFEVALGASGEIKNPKRNIPLGILLGGGAVLIVYLLLQFTVQGALGTEMEAMKDAPLAAVAKKIIGSVGATVLLITAAVSCFGAVSTDVLSTPRVLFAGAKNGIYPAIFAKVHSRFSTPYWSIIIFAGLIFLFSISGGFEQLAILASAAILIIYLLVVLATLKLRRKKAKQTETTFRAPGGLVIPLTGIISILWVLSSLSKMEIISTVIFIGVISILYFGMKWIKSR